ncbi:unnamed protein product [Cyprideis torosa]|uniref:Uncharacterized protein n=1 Tax=Cyprideis torosa TaxID=163714 RepID=A0A7R8WER6_9CRUS|nr:unnamed protein product [Cyprideis torosa]CAG0891025.1 unnamed protein product [Cyprideis torosa]
MASELPIDIQTTKLLDWLQKRRHISAEWPKHVLEIRKKINEAIQDMPEHPGIAKLLSGSHINYFHCLRIIEILRETEKDSKNIFGFYGSQRMKDWQEIVRLYQKDRIFLAEASQMLVRNVNFEIPALKRALAKGGQQIEECERRAAELGRAAEAARGRYRAECGALGVSPLERTQDDPGQLATRRELMSLLRSELPKLYEKVTEAVKGLGPGREFYEAFLEFTLGGAPVGGVLPLVGHVVAKGNTTVYEWVFGEPPLEVERAEVGPFLEPVAEVEVGTEAGDEIDFGDEESPSGSSPVVLSVGNGDSNGEEIDWGDGALEGFECVTVAEGGPEVAEVGSGVAEITVEASGVEGGVARGSDALSILENPTTRGTLLDEVLELSGFIQQRLDESSSSDSVMTLSVFRSAPPLVAMAGPEALTEFEAAAQRVVSAFRDEKLQHLMRLQASPRYVERLAAGVQQRLRQVERLQEARAQEQAKGEAIAQEQKTSGPRLELLIEKTRELQKDIEKEVSQLCKGRPVHLMGGATAL